jgi:hypothetical protein
MKTRTRAVNTSVPKNAQKTTEPVVIKVRRMRGGKAHLVEESDEEMVELTLHKTIEEQ